MLLKRAVPQIDEYDRNTKQIVNTVLIHSFPLKSTTVFCPLVTVDSDWFTPALCMTHADCHPPSCSVS